ncbi:hypothetical protein BD413DRAFT_266792 [Trametes elegans]|nr:hypothetical protein BD413DRAFT_266792 [Trametes elegans]
MPQSVGNGGQDEQSVSVAVQVAQKAIDGAARPGDQSRAGKIEEKVVNSINKVGQSSDELSVLMEGVNSLVESLPPLMRALDAVAQVHPFVAIAVGAFKVVIELEVKRRDNDKKINLLFLEMRNMMAVLTQLQSVRANHIGRDGLTVGARLEELVKKTAQDIEECANACDAYARKRLLVKVFKASSWDGTLKDYVKLFTDRKGEFTFAVSVHTGLAVDRANDQLDMLVTKMDLVLVFFQKTAPREQRALAEAIRQEGGADAVLAKTEVMQELLLKEQQLAGVVMPSSEQGSTPYSYVIRTRSAVRPGTTLFSRAAEQARTRRPAPMRRHRHSVGHEYRTPEYGLGGYGDRSTRTRREGRWRSSGWPGEDEEGDGPAGGTDTELAQLVRELEDDPAVAIKKNFVVFERKFRIQQREIVEEMTRVIVHEGDRVISTVLEGPHERIIDPDLYEIWKDMRWRGIVKARHLVLAIHDYYMQRLDDQRRAEASGSTSPRAIPERDLWALECIDLMHLQPIMEALDNDVSGFVTIQEVNYFTTSRPQGWSLLQWLAYWAVGWQVAMTEYKHKIEALVVRMRKMETAVRGRGSSVRVYLETVEPLVECILRVFREETEHGFLLPRFEGYVHQEEARLRGGLETARYELDALDTLALINGPRGLERNVFVVMYLLLQRHYDVMRAGCEVLLHPGELADAAMSISLVKDAMDYRVEEISSLFSQRRLSIPTEMCDFACGMLATPYGVYCLLPEDAVDDHENTDVKSDIVENVLKYPPHREDFYPESDDAIDDDGTNIAENLKPLLGHWAGIMCYDYNGCPFKSSFTVTFHIPVDDATRVTAVPTLSMPWWCTRTSAIGEFAGITNDGRPMFTITETFNASYILPSCLNVTLSVDGTKLVGEQDRSPWLAPSAPKLSVIMKKGTPPEIMLLYPTVSAFEENRPATLWRFATSAVLSDIRRRRLSWSVLKERRDRKRLLVSLMIAQSSTGSLHPEDRLLFAQLADATVPADYHFFGYASVEPARFPWVLPWCVQCRRVLRTVEPCLRCWNCERTEGSGSGAALCGRAECLEEHLQLDEPEPPHLLVKTRVPGWTKKGFLVQTVRREDALGELHENSARALIGEEDANARQDPGRRCGWTSPTCEFPGVARSIHAAVLGYRHDVAWREKAAITFGLSCHWSGLC